MRQLARGRRSVVLFCGAALAATLVLVSCAPRQAAQTTPPEPPQVEREPLPAPPPAELSLPDPQPIYERLERGLLDYESAVETIAAGEEVLGEEKLAGASKALRLAAGDCADMVGCEMGRFFEAYDRLLDSQNMALKQQALRIADFEADLAEDLEREPGTSPFVSAMPEIGKTVSLLRGTELREIITLNGPVNAAIDDWLTWRRPLLLEAHANYQFLRDEMAPVYEKAGLPEALLFAMIATESGGKVHAYSRAGAAGPLQFMRRTGQRYGLRTVDGFDMRLDPASATEANVAYLNDQFAALNDNLEKALAAYNGGESRAQGLHRRLHGASFWDSRYYYSLPRETREYVPRILAAAWLFLHAEDHRLEFPVFDVEKVEMQLDREMSLGELTVCLGQAGNPDGWFRTLRNLNPRLEPGDRIPAGESIRVPASIVPLYVEHCHDEKILARAYELHEANYPPEPEMIRYTVQRGDTLGRIATRHRCVSMRELAAINGIRPPRYTIRVGQMLKIPTCG